MTTTKTTQQIIRDITSATNFEQISKIVQGVAYDVEINRAALKRANFLTLNPWYRK